MVRPVEGWTAVFARSFVLKTMLEKVEGWFAGRGWEVFPFQREVWEAFAAGESGLVHCSTGAGKTYAVWFAALLAEQLEAAGSLRVLWVTPLRALAADTERALLGPLEELDLDWSVGRRTGDTSSHTRKKQMDRPPNALVTTPESLCVLLSQPRFLPQFAGLQMVVVDEWHELISSKRGVLTELALARLRALAPGMRTWGLSATLGNTEEAARVLGGYGVNGQPRPMRIVRGAEAKKVVIETVLPPEGERFAWAGHLGLQLVKQVVARLRESASTIVFTNTRSQAELWYQALRGAMPDWESRLGLHHGSLANEVRAVTEAGLRSGELRAVVATSSLDLGVDFAPVECVVQIGSPKGVARLMQRAGRSGHQPGAVSRICCVPANTFELVEIAAARDLAETRKVEAREPLRGALDVLCQHMVTVAAGESFRAAELKVEVRGTHAFAELTDEEWDWALNFAARGGEALRAYPEYARMAEEAGVYSMREEAMAVRHRLGIGTITGSASVEVRFANGTRLGSVEESFVAKIRPGDRFLFAGRTLELVRVRDLRATVKAGGKRSTGVPRWMGGRMPLSSQLAAGVRRRLDEWSRSRIGGLETAGQTASAPRCKAEGETSDGERVDVECLEMHRLAPVLEIQARMSWVPGVVDLLVERLKSREGWHIFFYPFEGRLAHEGLAALFAYRIARLRPLTFSLAVNDYGFELLSAEEAPLAEALEAGLLDEAGLTEDILGSLHSTEMARRRFREIARIAGLVVEGVGRARKSARAMTISSSLLFDVFQKYDGENLLLGQATREVLESELELTRMVGALERMRGMQHVVVDVAAATPLAYPLFVARLREQLSSEALADRVRRMEVAMERVGGDEESRGRKVKSGTSRLGRVGD